MEQGAACKSFPTVSQAQRRYAATLDKPLILLARSERFELPTLGFEVQGSSRVHSFPILRTHTIPWHPVERPSTARDTKPPGGPSIFGGFALGTGPQEKTHVHKMGKLMNGVTEGEFELDSHPGDAVLIRPSPNESPAI